jgi:hypothetical protein
VSVIDVGVIAKRFEKLHELAPIAKSVATPVNFKTANALGPTVPLSQLGAADEVIKFIAGLGRRRWRRTRCTGACRQVVPPVSLDSHPRQHPPTAPSGRHASVLVDGIKEIGRRRSLRQQRVREVSKEGRYQTGDPRPVKSQRSVFVMTSKPIFPSHIGGRRRAPEPEARRQSAPARDLIAGNRPAPPRRVTITRRQVTAGGHGQWRRKSGRPQDAIGAAPRTSTPRPQHRSNV